MSESSSRTFLIIALVAFVLLVAWPVKLLLFAPVGVLNGIFHHRPFEHAIDWSWPWIGVAGFFALAALLVWIAITVWVYRDAEKRGMTRTCSAANRKSLRALVSNLSLAHRTGQARNRANRVTGT